MPEDDQPDERIWLDTEAIAAHFEAVHERHKSGGAPPEEQPDLHDNELTKGLRR